MLRGIDRFFLKEKIDALKLIITELLLCRIVTDIKYASHITVYIYSYTALNHSVNKYLHFFLEKMSISMCVSVVVFFLYHW